MSVFDEIMADSGRPTLMEQFGDVINVMYEAPGETPLSLTAAVGRIDSEETRGESGRQRVQERLCTFSKDPDSEWGGIANPRADATVVIDSVRWPVKAVSAESETFVSFILVRSAPVERSRPAYRGRGRQ